MELLYITSTVTKCVKYVNKNVGHPWVNLSLRTEILMCTENSNLLLLCSC